MILAILAFAIFQSCSRRIPYSIKNDNYTQISVKPFSVSYYGDYRFYKPTPHDLALVRQFIHKANFNLSVNRNDIVYVAKTKISPFYEQVLLKTKKSPLNQPKEKIIKMAVSTSAVYYYNMDVKNEHYMFVHHQIEVGEHTPIDSMTSKKEFLFMVTSIQRHQ